MGTDGLFGNRRMFNIGVAPYYRLKFRPTKPIYSYYMIPYDVLLEFDYKYFIESDGGFRWSVAQVNPPLIFGSGPGPELPDTSDERWNDEITHPHTDHRHSTRDVLRSCLENGQNPFHWELIATGSNWELTQGGNSALWLGIIGLQVYEIEHRELADQGIRSPAGLSSRCHFDGLGENRFLYMRTESSTGITINEGWEWFYDTLTNRFIPVDTTFIGGVPLGIVLYEENRPDITIEPYWP